MPDRPRAPLPPLEDVKRLLGLEPLEPEGGFFAETYRCRVRVFKGGAGADGLGYAPLSTAIYYLITADQVSRLHRLPSDEVYHFYLGDPVDLIQFPPEGGGRRIRLGGDLLAGQRPQAVVPAGVWQGAQPAAGGRWALLGTTMSPGFEFADLEPADRDALLALYPEHAEVIRALTAP